MKLGAQPHHAPTHSVWSRRDEAAISRAKFSEARLYREMKQLPDVPDWMWSLYRMVYLQ